MGVGGGGGLVARSNDRRPWWIVLHATPLSKGLHVRLHVTERCFPRRALLTVT